MGNTTNMPEVRINRALTIDIVSGVLDAPHGKGALLLLTLLIWRRQYDGDDWITVTNGEWKKRVNKDRKVKYRAGETLENLGLVTIRRTGKQSLQYKLAPHVDPLAIQKKIVRDKGTLSRSENIVNLADLPDPIINGSTAAVGECIIASLAKR
jgi:hypothetical protein